MGRVRTSDPDVIAYRSGGGCLMLFGLPFLLAGLFVMASPLVPGKYQPKESKTGRPMPIYFAIPFGGIFATVGAALVLGRAGKRIDRRAGTVSTWWGLLVPFRCKEMPLADFDKVAITHEVRRSKNSTYTVYPVRLRGEGSAKVDVETPRDEAKARALGEEIAKFLTLPLHDSSVGSVVIRQADELDESLRERAERTGERAEVGSPPPDARAISSVTGDILTFEIPPLGFRPLVLFIMGASLLCPLVFAGVFVVPFTLTEDVPLGVKLIFAGVLCILFIGVPVGIAWTFALRMAKKTARVDVSPLELRVTVRGLFRSSTHAIPTAELEELQVVNLTKTPKATVGPKIGLALLGSGGVILARSDRATLTFGTGLSAAELDWMRDVIWNVVTA